MPTDFRREVFLVCKSLQKKEDAKEIGTLVHELSVSVESKKTGSISKTVHGDFAYLAKHSNNEFHGYLFIDDNADKIDLPQYFKVEHLTIDERMLIERGHKTLTRFIELCLSDIMRQSNTVAAAINPYFLFRDVNYNKEVESLLSDVELQPVASAYKNGKVYKALVNSKFTYIFEKIDIISMRELVSAIEKEVNKSLGEDISSDLKDFSSKLVTRFENSNEVMFAFSILMLALRESLKMACHLLYKAICGIDLIVLNNDNIINIEKSTSNTVCEFYKVLVQDVFINHSGSDMGSILLLDCDPGDGIHIHEFGMIIAQTISLAGEYGQTTKHSFITINEEMIHIHPLTNAVLRIGLPKVQIRK